MLNNVKKPVYNFLKIIDFVLAIASFFLPILFWIFNVNFEYDLQEKYVLITGIYFIYTLLFLNIDNNDKKNRKLKRGKNISNKMKQKINTLLLIISAIALLSFFFFPTDVDEATIDLISALWMGYFSSFTTLWMTTGVIWEDDIESVYSNRFGSTTKYKIKYKNFEELAEEIDKNIKNTDYELKLERKISAGLVNIFAKPIINNIHEIIVFTYTSEYTKELAEEEQQVISDYLVSVYGDEKIKGDVRLLKVLCVDRLSLQFRKNVSYDINFIHHGELMEVGLSFGSKMLYIMEQKKHLFSDEEYEYQEYFKGELFKLIEAEKVVKEKKKVIKRK